MIELLACFGITFLLCDAAIIARPRAVVRRIPFVDALLKCYFCTGFWVALALFWYLGRRNVDLVVWSFAGASAAYVINALVLVLERWNDG